MPKKTAENKKISYLSSLKFDKSLLLSYQAKYIAQIRFVILLILSIVILGISSFTQLPRRLNPEIKIPIVSVTTILPGGTPEDMESLITIPLEDKIKSVKGIDTMSSTSSDSVSSIVLQFTSKTDQDKARNDVEKLVSEVRDLPDDAQTPSIAVFDFEDAPIWSFVIYTNKDDASLMRFSKKLKDDIDALPKVDRVITAGYEKEYINVLFDPKKLAIYGLNPMALSQIVKGEGQSYPAGTVKTDTSSYSLALDAHIQSVEDIRSIRINVNGEVITLGDIATVSIQPQKDQPLAVYSDREHGAARAVQFFVYKASGQNIDAVEKDVQATVQKSLKDAHGDYSIQTSSNTAKDISDQFNELFGEFRSTILMVFLLLCVFLGLRQAVIASLTIPLTFLSAFTIIHALGMSLNFLTMFAFLLALGLLIDDTIVVVAAMTRYYKTGNFTPYESAILVWRDFIVPLWSTTITTIWAFVPLLLSTGIIGEFIKPIPIVVTATMLSSTTIAMLITIPLMAIFLKPAIPKRVVFILKILGIIAVGGLIALVIPKTPVFAAALICAYISVVFAYFARKELSKLFQGYIKKLGAKKRLNSLSVSLRRFADTGLLNLEDVAQVYMRVIRRILESKRNRIQTIIAVSVFVFSAYLLVATGFVKSEFFPKTDEENLYISVDMPQGTSLSKINQETYTIAEMLRTTEETEFLSVESGSAFDSQAGRTQNSHALLATLRLTPREDRNITSQELAEKLRTQFAEYENGEVLVQEVSGGPPAGADVQISLKGKDLTALSKTADDFIAFLKTQEGILNPKKSIESGTGKIVFKPDFDKLSTYEVSFDTIGMWMRTYAQGFELDTLRQGSDDISIQFNFYDTLSPESLYALEIPTRNGFIPLSSLGTFTLENNPTLITRENGERTIQVYAAAAKGYNVQDLNNKLIGFAEEYSFEDGYSWKTGGVNEENEKSVQSILQAMILSALLILITMVIEFGSFRQAFLALLIIPISISSVFYIFGLTGIPLSFPALIGILALFGIVVTHAIVVIEKINDNIKEGLTLTNAIVDAAGNRLEPVVLTSLATILGLIPITLADPLWRGLGGAIIAGLMFSGIIKLFLVPVLYYSFYSEDKVIKNKKSH